MLFSSLFHFNNILNSIQCQINIIFFSSVKMFFFSSLFPFATIRSGQSKLNEIRLTTNCCFWILWGCVNSSTPISDDFFSQLLSNVSHQTAFWELVRTNYKFCWNENHEDWNVRNLLESNDEINVYHNEMERKWCNLFFRSGMCGINNRLKYEKDVVIIFMCENCFILIVSFNNHQHNLCLRHYIPAFSRISLHQILKMVHKL